MIDGIITQHIQKRRDSDHQATADEVKLPCVTVDDMINTVIAQCNNFTNQYVSQLQNVYDELSNKMDNDLKHDQQYQDLCNTKKTITAQMEQCITSTNLKCYKLDTLITSFKELLTKVDNDILNYKNAKYLKETWMLYMLKQKMIHTGQINNNGKNVINPDFVACMTVIQPYLKDQSINSLDADELLFRETYEDDDEALYKKLCAAIKHSSPTLERYLNDNNKDNTIRNLLTIFSYLGFNIHIIDNSFNLAFLVFNMTANTAPVCAKPTLPDGVNNEVGSP
jgi:hypothetical protein